MRSGVAARVHIACLKQFSGHASLKSLEEYAKLEKLRQNRLLRDVPLIRARRSSAPACPAPFVGRRGRVGQGDQALDETVKKGPALARSSPYSYHVKGAALAHLPNPPHIGEGCMLNGSGHTSHEKPLLRDVLIPS